MKEFIQRYEDRIHGVLSCFDRMLFRGYLPIMSGWQMAQFFNSRNIRFRKLKTFLVEQAQRVKQHGIDLAKKEGRPFQYVQEKTRKDDVAKEIAARDKIEEGLIVVFSVLEPCRTFSFRFEKGKPFVQSARRKCLFLYFYFMDRDFGLIHVRLQTWFPLQVQVYVNGHEWLARKLDKKGIRYRKLENAFVWIEDLAKAQKLSDRFASLNWPRLLARYAKKINPLLGDLLRSMSYYRVTTQSEYSTDILFKSPDHLEELFPRLLSHSTLCFGARQVMSFLGRKLYSHFQGDIVSDVMDFAVKRLPGIRIKHRVKQNWIKMYNKAGSVLRLEMVINDPTAFKMRKKVCRNGKHVMEWGRHAQGCRLYVSLSGGLVGAANGRYLDALAEVDDPTDAIQALDRITTRKQVAPKRTVKAFNPVAREDHQLFQALLNGQHCVRGFSNPDIRDKLRDSPFLKTLSDAKRQSAKVSRLLHRCHAHGLIAKVPHSRRWRVTRLGRVAMAASIQLREIKFPAAYTKLAS